MKVSQNTDLSSETNSLDVSAIFWLLLERRPEEGAALLVVGIQEPAQTGDPWDQIVGPADGWRRGSDHSSWFLELNKIMTNGSK